MNTPAYETFVEDRLNKHVENTKISAFSVSLYMMYTLCIMVFRKFMNNNGKIRTIIQDPNSSHLKKQY